MPFTMVATVTWWASLRFSNSRYRFFSVYVCTWVKQQGVLENVRWVRRRMAVCTLSNFNSLTDLSFQKACDEKIDNQ